MITIDNRALFVGVNDYRAFDESMGHRAGTSDLHGSLNDARAFWRVCRELGIPPENLLILTSPPLDPAELGAPASSVGEATEAAIVAGVAWLAAQLGGEGRPPGLLTYSGHGDFVEGVGLVLCPSDVVGANLTHAIPFAKLQRLLADGRATANLTVVLDCCHSGGSAADPARRRLSLTGRPLPSGLARDAVRLSDRELCACKVGESSWQARFSGVFRGAFSWALSAVLEQWKPRIEGTSVELELSYGTLLLRTRQLLAALSFDEEPVLRGAPGVAAIPVFHRGPGGAGEATSAAPTAQRKGGQLDPDSNHTLRTSASQSTWQVSATAAAASLPTGQGYSNATEYWALDSAFIADIQRIVAQRSGFISFNDSTSSASRAGTGFSMPTNSLWTTLPAMPTGELLCALVQPPDGSPQYCVGVRFELTAPARAGEIWGGVITWYVGIEAGAPFPEYVIGKGTTKLAYQALSTDLARYEWAFMILPPLTWSTVESGIQSNVGAPSLAALGATLYAAVSSETAMSLVTLSYDVNDGSWSTLRSGALPDAAFPSLTAAGNELVLAYQSSSAGGEVLLASSPDPRTTAWTRLGSTGLDTLPGGFALATRANGEVYLAYLSPSSSFVYVDKMDGRGVTGWALALWVAEAASGTPALAVFNDQLYLAFTTTDAVPTLRIFQGSCSDEGAPVVAVTLSPVTDGASGGVRAPVLAVFNGRLFLACCDASSTEVWLCSTSDGVTWSGYEKLTDQIPSIKAAVHPGLAAVGNVFVLACPVPNGSSADVSSVATLIPQ